MYGLLYLHSKGLFRLAFLGNLRKSGCSPIITQGHRKLGKYLRSIFLDTLFSHFYSSAPGLCWAPSWQMRLVPSALKCLSNLSRAQPVWEKGTRFLLRNPPVSPHIPSPMPGTGTIHLMGRRV